MQHPTAFLKGGGSGTVVKHEFHRWNILIHPPYQQSLQEGENHKGKFPSTCLVYFDESTVLYILTQNSASFQPSLLLRYLDCKSEAHFLILYKVFYKVSKFNFHTNNKISKSRKD